MKTIAFWTLGLLITVLSFMPEAAPARHTIGAVGPMGDAQDQLNCGPREELRGFRGMSGMWIDKIQILCAVRMPDGIYAEAAPRDKTVGGAGGAEQQESCRSSEELVRIAANSSEDGRQIALIRLVCRGQGGQETVRVFGTTVRFSDDSLIVGDCRRHEESLVGVVANHGKALNGLGFVCDRFVQFGAQRAPSPSGDSRNCGARSATGTCMIYLPNTQTQRGPPTPHETQTARGTYTTKRSSVDADAASSGSVDPRTRFTGAAWTVQMKPGQPFTVVFYPGQKAGELVGQIQGGRQPGMLSGTIDPDGQTLRFSYSMPDPHVTLPGILLSGTGTLKSFGHVMGGMVTSQRGSIEWVGNRRK